MQKTTLGVLDLENNAFEHVPRFQEEPPGLKTLKISSNPIYNIESDTFINLTYVEHISMKKMLMIRVPNNVFSRCSRLHTLDLSNNTKLEVLSNEAFVGADIRFLDISDSKISYLPHLGLEKLVDLKIAITPNLWEISNNIVAIPSLRKVRVASNQRWLCCAFSMKRTAMKVPVSSKPLNESLLCPTGIPRTTSIRLSSTRASTDDPFGGFGDSGRLETTKDPFEDFLGGFGKKRKRRGFGLGSFVPGNGSVKPTGNTKPGIEFTDNFLPNTPVIHTRGVICNPNITGSTYAEEILEPVECTPEPDALQPCDDIMGNVFLTSISWIFSIVALLGNAMVFCVLILSRRGVSVTKFLLINLSFADLCLALYLFILVSASTHTHGNYYNYVKEWQFSGGCSIAGSLAIFSSQLSMLVLVVITIERYFAIVHAMHFHRRVTMHHATIGMVAAWFISLFMAILPLAGVNSYTEVAICLPFRTETNTDMAYIGIVLILNLTFFIFVLVSYLRMFLVVRSPHLEGGSGGQQRNDSEVAKRMALLVFTDFFCWGPIAFVGLWSAFGDTDTLGMTVKNSKFLLVIFFPINALCNPFLYAVSTNSFKRDFYDLLIRCGLCQDCIARINEGAYTNSMSQKHSMRSDTLTSSIGRHASSVLKSPAEKSGLLSKVLAKRVKMDHQINKYVPNTPDMSIPGTPMTDNVFETPAKNYTENPFFKTVPSIRTNEGEEASERDSLFLTESSPSVDT
eukprot:TCONS_00033095-protein